MQNNIIVFDTETNGLPTNYKASFKDLANWPRIIQLAFAVFNENGDFLRGFTSLIKPDGWVVPKQKFWIENGYSTEICEEKGVDMSYALCRFIDELADCKTLVAHNMQFDKNVLSAEMMRYGLRAIRKPEKVCTKDLGTPICQLPNKYGGFKWPTLQELHLKLFSKSFDGAHDALMDVNACAACYFEMVKNYTKIK